MYKVKITTFQFSPIRKSELNKTFHEASEAHDYIVDYFDSLSDCESVDLVKKYEQSAKRASQRGCPVVVYSHPSKGILIRHFVEVTETKVVHLYGLIATKESTNEIANKEND